MLNPRIKLNPSIPLNYAFTNYEFVNFFLFFALLPYVSPVPIGTDVQLMSGAIAFSILMVLFLRDGLRLDREELALLFLCLIFLLHINFEANSYQLRKAIGPFYGFGIYYVAKRYNHLFSIKVVRWVIFIYFIAAAVQYVSPGMFELTFERFIRESKYASGSIRGLSSLAPESSFLGIVSVYLLVVMEWFVKTDRVDKNLPYKFFYFLAVFLVILSKSGTGYILLFLFFAFKFWSRFRKFWPIFLIGAVLALIILANIPIGLIPNKGLSNLIQLAQSLSNTSLIWRLGSLSNRITPVLVGLHGFVENPFGYGSGAFPFYSVEVFYKSGISDIFPHWQIPRLIREISEDSNSTFGKYIFEYGIFYLLFLFVLLRGLDYRKLNLFTAFLLCSSILFSLPIVYPPIWILLGIFNKKN